MSDHISLGSLRLSCPSTGLDLALTSDIDMSTLAQSCSTDTPSITNIESGRIWLAPSTNFKLHLDIAWPSSTSSQYSNLLRNCLLTALRHAAVSITPLPRPVSIHLTSLGTLAMEPVESSTILDC
jgi:hypothetical protein